MLPQIFRSDDPVLEVTFAPEHFKALEKLLKDLPSEVFTADDSLGWVYQFWQTKKRKEVDASDEKVGADQISPVTQVFTEHYMVLFLLHNTLGAWWAVNHPHKSLPLEMEYLRLCGDGAVAAGTFPGWPKVAKELKVLDPSCGSGHFLIAIFTILVAFRMAEEGLSPADACDAVLRDNVYGLEIDHRCTQIAAFSLALAAWTYPGAGGYRRLPRLNIACSGLSVGSSKDEWRKVAGEDQRLKASMLRLYDLFEKAPILGSLINPKTSELNDFVYADFQELLPILETVLDKETIQSSPDIEEAGVTAYGMAMAASILAKEFSLVITNVPYLARGKQCDELKDFCQNNYAEAKGDLATVFLRRCLELAGHGGTAAVVIPQNWLFLSTYRSLREVLLQSATINVIATLGPAAFQDMNWWAAKTALVVITRCTPDYTSVFSGFDASETKEITGKIELLLSSRFVECAQSNQANNPDARITSGEHRTGTLLEDYCRSYQGIATGDYSLFGCCFWERAGVDDIWDFQQSTVAETNQYAGREHILLWEKGRGALSDSPGARVQGLPAHGNLGVAVSQMNRLLVTLYTGDLFDNNTAAIIPNNPAHLPAVWMFCSSPEFHDQVRRIDQATKVTNAALTKVPFDLEYWQKVAEEKYPNGLPKPYSEDPTQWIFHGHPANTEQPLQVALARLLGYRWPAELDPEMELSNEAREWVKRCENLSAFVDNDGICCIPSVRGEETAAERLRKVLAAAFGEAWTTAKQVELLNAVGYSGKTLEDWLRDGFFEQHCKVFHNRPFIWQIWDGRKDGFSALVNYHKLDNHLLQTLAYTYVGDWIRVQEDAAKQGIGGADGRLVAAKNLQDKLKLILAGEPPYDIFVRWKPIDQQPLGWEPDLNDGVRMNIRPYVEAGILRKKFTINWKKDRGNEPQRPKEQFPWFWNGGKFTGERVNEVHLSIEEKKAARENKS